MLCASHRDSLNSQMGVASDLEKNIAARGKGLAKASLPSNHLAEAGAGALWDPEGMHLPLALEKKQIKMFILGAAGILEGMEPSSYLKIVSYSPRFGFFTYPKEERKVSMQRWGLEAAVAGC